MSSRDTILANIRKNTQTKYEKPDYRSIEEHAIRYPDLIGQFTEVMKQMGGQAVLLQEGDDLNALIRSLYPEAKRIASTVAEVDTAFGKQTVDCDAFHPDTVAAPGDLDGTDLAIVQGRLGVCENGAVWIEQEVEQRAVYFIAEALVILLDRKALKNNMHEAYPLIDTGKYGFGVFISGPSKTADIEQALVMGAHGARSVTVILV